MQPPRRIALGLIVCGALALALTALLGGLSPAPVLRVAQLIALVLVGGSVLVALVGLVAVRAADWREPAGEDDFERVVRRSERLARDGLAAEPDEADFAALDPFDDEEFEQLVGEALDDLPPELRRALANLAVVISNGGRRRGAYGLYHGDGAARDDFPDRIVIYRDTLRRDFGHDPDLLREQVTRTVRHELAHHLGWDELGVRGLGL